MFDFHGVSYQVGGYRLVVCRTKSSIVNSSRWVGIRGPSGCLPKPYGRHIHPYALTAKCGRHDVRSVPCTLLGEIWRHNVVTVSPWCQVVLTKADMVSKPELSRVLAGVAVEVCRKERRACWPVRSRAVGCALVCVAFMHLHV
jgi:hypothetical protein